MKCSSSSRPKSGGGSLESAVGFLGLKRIFLKVMVAAMGCVFSCFRVKDSTPNRPSSSPTANANDSVVTRRRRALSSLLLSEENDGRPIKETEDLELGISKPELEFDYRELKNEAKFLKACGTLPETPVELRKVAQVKKDLSGHNGEHEGENFTSWLTNKSVEKLNLEKQPNQPPSPIKVCEEWMKGSDSLEQTPSSCMTERQDTDRFSASSPEGSGFQNATSIKVTASSVPFKNKLVRFDCEPDLSSASSKSYSSEISSQNSKQSGSAGNHFAGKPSPYPTPLKLTDEMQTPGTVFPAYLDGTGQAKTRIRSQYVYPVSNPVESLSQWEVLKDEESNTNILNNDNGESLRGTDEANAISEAWKGDNPGGQDLKVEASLSPWSRVPPSDPDGNSQENGSSDGANFHFRIAPDDRPILGMVAAHWNDDEASRTSPRLWDRKGIPNPDGNSQHYKRTPADRPILGMVAAHWNDDEVSHISPKWWDGNGIPNSTNKYKEDQKVSWHATPFEERLEKALSDETFINQRNPISGTGAIDFNEAEESDTAQSKFESSNHFKSVVSH